ncbi:MAG: hypothetical protein WBP71_00025, partial [Terracidiphilus sp.]
ERGEPLATIYATTAAQLAEPEEIIRKAIMFSKSPPHAVPLVGRVFTREEAEKFLQDGVR